MAFLRKYRYEIVLIAVIVIAAAFRFYKLSLQSLWYDELYTMNEASPYVSWKQLFYYCQTDQHPPLYFILQRLAFNILGYTEWAARFIAALAGVASVYASYILGKEVRNKELGLLMAIITAVNPFSIYFSQMARPYPLVWFFTCISYLYFIRLSKRPGGWNMVGYALSTVLLVYTNYFGFLAVGVQLILAVIRSVSITENRNRFARYFLIAGVIAAVCYLPWMPSIFKLDSLKPAWIPMPSPSFPLHYYYDYFGAFMPVLPLLVLLPGIFIWHTIKEIRMAKYKGQGSLFSITVLISIAIIFPFAVLYLRSVFHSPTLTTRYTIVVVPFFIMLLASSLLLIKQRILYVTSVCLFAGLNIAVVIKERYQLPSWMPYRELVQVITSKKVDHPLVNEYNAWHIQYYTKMYEYKGLQLTGNKNRTIDSICAPGLTGGIDTFWLFIGFMDKDIDVSRRAKLYSKFNVIEEYNDGFLWLRLFARRKDDIITDTSSAASFSIALPSSQLTGVAGFKSK